MNTKNILMLGAALMLLATPAMATQKTRANLQSGFTTSFPNASHITAATLLAEMNNMSDSCNVPLTDLGTGVATFLATPSSANLLGALTTSTGSGNAVFATNPVLVTPALGTPSSGTLTNATGLPEAGLTLADNTTANASTSAHGFLLKLNNSATTYMNGQGAWTTPAGAGNVVGPGSSTDTALPRFSGTGGLTLQNGTVTEDSSGNLAAVGTIASGAHTITSASATSLAVGPNGTTNPVFAIDGSAASAVTGLKLTSAASAGGFTVATTSSNSNEAATWNMSLGTGAATIGTPGNATMNIKANGTTRYSIGSGGTVHTWTSATSGSNGIAGHFVFTAPADTATTGGTNTVQTLFDMSATRQHASNTAVALDIGVKNLAPTFSYASSGGVTTDAASLYFDGGPSAGTNATITNSSAILIPTKALAGTVTNGYGINVAAPTGGATTNYAINATGGSKMDIIVAGGTKFTASGCTNSATHGGAAAGDYTSGTTGACTVVVTINGATGYTAPTGWACWAADRTTPANIYQQSASSTTTATLTGTTVSGDVISFGCVAY